MGRKHPGNAAASSQRFWNLERRNQDISFVCEDLSRRYSTRFRSGVADRDEQRDFIKETIKNLISKDGNYATRALNYAVACLTFEPDPEDNPDPLEYYEFMKRQRYTTSTENG